MPSTGLPGGVISASDSDSPFFFFFLLFRNVAGGLEENRSTLYQTIKLEMIYADYAVSVLQE